MVWTLKKTQTKDYICGATINGYLKNVTAKSHFKIYGGVWESGKVGLYNFYLNKNYG